MPKNVAHHECKCIKCGGKKGCIQYSKNKKNDDLRKHLLRLCTALAALLSETPVSIFK